MMKYFLKDSGRRVNFVAVLFWVLSVIGSEICMLIGGMIAGALTSWTALLLSVGVSLSILIGCYLTAMQLQCLAEAAGGINGTRAVEGAGDKMQFVSALLLALDFAALAMTPVTGLVLAIVQKNAWVFIISLLTVLLPAICAWMNALMFKCLGDMAGGNRKVSCFLLQFLPREASPMQQLLTGVGLLTLGGCLGAALMFALVWGISAAGSIFVTICLAAVALVLLCGLIWFAAQCILAMTDALLRGLLDNAGPKTQLMASAFLLLTIVFSVLALVGGLVWAAVAGSGTVAVLAVAGALLLALYGWIQSQYMQALGDAASGEVRVAFVPFKPLLGQAPRTLHRIAALILAVMMALSAVVAVGSVIRAAGNTNPTMAEAVDDLAHKNAAVRAEAEQVTQAMGSVKLDALIDQLQPVSPALADEAAAWITPGNYTLAQTVELLKPTNPDVEDKAMDVVLAAGFVDAAVICTEVETVSLSVAAQMAGWLQEAQALLPGDHTVYEVASILEEKQPGIAMETMAALTELSHIRISDLVDLLRPVDPAMADLAAGWMADVGDLLSGDATMTEVVTLLTAVNPDAQNQAQDVAKAAENLKLSDLADLLEPADATAADYVAGWKSDVVWGQVKAAGLCILAAAAIFLGAWAVALTLQALSDAASKQRA